VSDWLLHPWTGRGLHAMFAAFSPFLLGALSSGLELPFNKERFKGGGKQSSPHRKQMRGLPESGFFTHLNNPSLPAALMHPGASPCSSTANIYLAPSHPSFSYNKLGKPFHNCQNSYLPSSAVILSHT